MTGDASSSKSTCRIEASMTVKTIAFDVDWGDGWANTPRLKAIAEGLPERDADTIYEKHPINDPDYPGWHVYLSDIDGYVWFFTWGGKPDQGFGGWRRDVKLSDGTTETVVGGWHASNRPIVAAGLPPVIEVVTTRAEEAHGVGSAGFMTVERVRRELQLLRPDLELLEDRFGWTVKWRGQLSKDKWMALGPNDNSRRNHVSKQRGDVYSALGPVEARNAA